MCKCVQHGTNPDFGTNPSSRVHQIHSNSVVVAVSQGLAALAAFNIARGDEQSVEEAVDLLNEACATTKGTDEEEETIMAEGDVSLGEGADGKDDGATSAVLLAHASVLCTSAQGELLLGRGTATASERLGEALRIREKLLPAGHPATVRLETCFFQCRSLLGWLDKVLCGTNRPCQRTVFVGIRFVVRFRGWFPGCAIVVLRMKGLLLCTSVSASLFPRGSTQLLRRPFACHFRPKGVDTLPVGKMSPRGWRGCDS